MSCSSPARPPQAHLPHIDWRLACTHWVLRLCYVNLVAHSGCRFYIFSSSLSYCSASSSAAPTTTTTTTPSTISTRGGTITNDPASTSCARDTSGSNLGTSADEIMFDSLESGGGGVASDSRSASMGAISPVVVTAAAPPPPPFGGLGTGAPVPGVEQNMAFARFQKCARQELNYFVLQSIISFSL